MVLETGVNSFGDPDKAAHFDLIAAVCCAEDGQAHPIRAGSAGGATGGVLWRMAGDMSCGLLPRWCARHRFLPAPKDLDDAHWAAAAGARLAQGARSGIIRSPVPITSDQ